MTAGTIDQRDTVPATEHHDTREAWLQALTSELRPWFAEVGLTVPEVRVSVGFTSKGARSKRIGECWYPHTAKDGVSQVFLHPSLDNPYEVAATLLHELIHASLGPGAKHGPDFKRPALALGLAGRMTATTGTPELTERLTPVLDALGPYPHARLNPDATTPSTGPKQTTRMLKVECPVDGYLVRTTQKWLDAGMPICPWGHEMEVAG